jgi:hypothetical protein
VISADSSRVAARLLGEPSSLKAAATAISPEDTPERSLAGPTSLKLTAGPSPGPVSREDPARRRKVAGVSVCVALEVVLLLGIGLPEPSCRSHLGENIGRLEAGGVNLRDRILGNMTQLAVRPKIADR